jgi:hypothetical protein
MCIWNRENNPKAAAMAKIGNLSLAIGLILWAFVIPFTKFQPNLLHFAAGLFLGISIAVNLGALKMARTRNTGN